MLSVCLSVHGGEGNTGLTSGLGGEVPQSCLWGEGVPPSSGPGLGGGEEGTPSPD